MQRKEKTQKILDTVVEVLNELQDYWPLTLRQIYYQLVSRLVIENHKNQYVRLSNILVRAREDGIIPWNVMEDRTRILHDLSGWPDADSFIDQEKDSILDGYRRDLDPSGLAIPESVKDGLLKLGIDVEVKRCALLPEDIDRYNLPHDPEALKPKDTRAKRYIDQYGHYAVELDALHPDTLIKRIIESIEESIDLSVFDKEVEQQDYDKTHIRLLREHLIDEMTSNQ